MGTDVDELMAQKCCEYIPVNMRSLLKPAEWAQSILVHREELLEQDAEVVQSAYVSTVKDHPLYGTCFFNVKRYRFPPHLESFPPLVIIALNR